MLLSTWSKNVGVDIEKQIKKWNSIDKKKNGKKLVTPYNFNKNHDQKPYLIAEIGINHNGDLKIAKN